MITEGKSAILAVTITIFYMSGGARIRISQGADWISTASGSERPFAKAPLATARGTDSSPQSRSWCGAFRDAPALQQVGYCGTRPTPKLVKSHTFNAITSARYLQFIEQRFWGNRQGHAHAGRLGRHRRVHLDARWLSRRCGRWTVHYGRDATDDREERPGDHPPNNRRCDRRGV